MAETTANEPGFGPELSPVQIAKLTGLVHEALHFSDTETGDASSSEQPEFEGRSFGRFEQLTAVGVGGFGCVYRAYDPRHTRIVALKIPYRRAVVDPDALQRFRTEMEAGAKIDHPGFVPLFEVGEVEGLPYLASAFCEGKTLSQWKRGLEADGRIFDPIEAARIALAVARAIAAAHDQGVIHRDVKPSNVILQPAVNAADVELDGDSYRVRVVDLGLAKLSESCGDLTRTDFRIGTPLYMAPEQVSRRYGPITFRTDVYGLGATLYALLAGREPFIGRNDVDLFAQVISEATPPLSKVRRGIPNGLAAICHCCLEKASADRYPSMHAVAEDLERFLQGRRVRARRAWIWKALRKAMRRRSVAIAVVVACALWLAVTAGKAWINWADRLQFEHQTASNKVMTLTSEKTEAEYLAAVPEAFANLNAGNYDRVRNFLERYENAKQAHHVEWRLLKGLADSALWAVKTDGEIRSTAVRGQHSFVFCGLSDGRVEVRSIGNGVLQHVLHGHRGPVNEILPFFGGAFLMTFGQDGQACVWGPPFNAPSSLELRKAFQAHDDGIVAASLSPDRRHIVTGGAGGRVKIWRAGSLSTNRTAVQQKGWPPDAFAPDGTLDGHVASVHDVCFSFDGRFMVTCGADGQFVWDFEKRRMVAKLPGSTQQRDKEHAQAKQAFFLWGGPPYRIASLFSLGPIVVNRFDPPQAPTIVFERTFEPRLRPVRAIYDRGRRSVLVTRDDGKTAAEPADDLLVTREDGTIASVPLDSSDGQIRLVGVGHGSRPNALNCNFEFRGQQVATGDLAGWLRLWDMERDSLSWSLNLTNNSDGSDDEVDCSSAGFVGRDYVYVDWSRRYHDLQIFRASDGSCLHREPPPGAEEGLRPRRAGAPIQVGNEIWRPWASGWQCFLLDRPGSQNPPAVLRSLSLTHFARDAMDGGPFLAYKDKTSGRVSLFTTSLAEIASIPDVFGSKSASNESLFTCQSDDGRWLALRSRESLRLFRKGSRLEEIALDLSGRAPPFSINDVAFSPNGDFLAAIFDDDDSVAVWSTSTGARHAVVYGRSKKLRRCVVTSDGKRILALEKTTGRINIWDARSAAALGSFSAGAPGDGAAFQLDQLGKRMLVYIRRHGRAFLEAGGDSVRVFKLAD